MMPRNSKLATVVACTLMSLSLGCQSPLFRAQSPEESEVDEAERSFRLVGDLASAWGLTYVKVEAIALVNGLDNTGSSPANGSQRNMLIGEMQTHEVKNPNQFVDLPSTSMVTISGLIPPGTQEGDRFDIDVRVPPRSETTSLRGGWLMPSRLREVAVLDNALHSGHVIALAGGPVLVNSAFEGEKNKVQETRGRILGGGIAQKTRPLGLVLREEHKTVRNSTDVASSINRRFHTFDRGIKKGVAEPKRDNFVELQVHPTYKNNLVRYVRVVRSVAINENASQLAIRIQSLERQLLEPTSAAQAALKLEAIGHEAVPILQKGIASGDPEVRFYSAEALAYLDEADAAQPLLDAVQNVPAFRFHALAALSVMDHVSAYDALTELLHSTSAETRYGAFKALRTRNPRDPLVRGEQLSDDFSYHTIPTTGDPMVHFTRFRRPEVVIFGHDQRILPPEYLFVGKGIMITGQDDGRLKVSHFSPGKDDQHEYCSTELDEVIRAIVEVGGGYVEVMEAVRAAKDGGQMEARVAIEAIPRRGRAYRRPARQSETEENASEDPTDGNAEIGAVQQASYQNANPIPDLYSNRLSDQSDENRRELAPIVNPDRKSKKGFFGRMTGWFGK